MTQATGDARMPDEESDLLMEYRYMVNINLNSYI